MAVAVAATEISAAELPDQIAVVLAVVGADAALAGIMGKATKLGATV